MKASLTVKMFLFVFVLSICLVAVPNPATAQKVITLNYSNFFPAPHKNSVLAEQWCREIEKRTNGRVKITYFPGGTLTPAAQTYDNTVKGIADIGESCFAYTRGKFPLLEVVDLPLGYKNGVVATKLVNEFYKKFQPKELGEVKVLFLHAHGPGILFTKKPVSKLEDVKGMKIRATGLAAKVVTTLGGAPVGTTMGETYDALRTGVAEGAFAPVEAMQGWKWGEVVRYTIQNFGSAYTTSMFVVMNKAKWNALPPDIQKIFDQVSAEFAVKQGKVWDEIDKEGYAFAQKRGVKVISLSKQEDARWAAKVRPLLDEYVANMKAKNLPGDQALKFCLDYLKANQK
ncbi:MAG: TRAP transporter substrate-binding protein [Syntrophorhabdus aromaticivorans]|uniref:TRAP transporter substrate-binding protein n=2 Tax=Syntrophorhabdus aromaticivorans TaxID=328301 RepID=A0A971S2Q3_9BACT|nr:TRAP transporter substrate-binding protein [Syntrophorhabdus aromaticivorans]